MITVIGAGGVGSWLVPKLIRVVNSMELFDGDVLEKKNLDRQLFDEDDIGQNKASALAGKYTSSPKMIYDSPKFFSSGMVDDDDEPYAFYPEDILFCCADNAAARRETLIVCDRFGCRCCIAANEYTDAEAYWYEPEWCNTPNDPRVFYPEMLTDLTGDPLAPQSCTGHAAEQSPQLVFANDMASSFACWLYWFHARTREELPREPEVEAAWPVHFKVNKFQFTTIRKGDRK